MVRVSESCLFFFFLALVEIWDFADVCRRLSLSLPCLQKMTLPCNKSEFSAWSMNFPRTQAIEPLMQLNPTKDLTLVLSIIHLIRTFFVFSFTMSKRYSLKIRTFIIVVVVQFASKATCVAVLGGVNVVWNSSCLCYGLRYLFQRYTHICMTHLLLTVTH